MEMVQMLKSTTGFELVGGANLAAQGAHRQFKRRSGFGQIRRFHTRNCRC
jgi:hypothetical protein